MSTSPNSDDVPPEGARCIPADLMRQRRRPVETDEFVSISVPFGWWMRQLKVAIDPAFHAEAYEQTSKEIRQSHMEQYFAEPVEVFQEKCPPAPDTRWVHYANNVIVIGIAGALLAFLLALAACSVIYQTPWIGIGGAIAVLGATIALLFSWHLSNRFLRIDRIWPGPLEDRLRATLERKFASADFDIRQVIDRFVDVFLDNAWTLILLKRAFQLAAIACFNIGMAVFLPLAGSSSPLLLGAGAVWFVVWVGLGYGLFFYWNGEVYENKYVQTLTRSTHEASNAVMKRMKDLTLGFNHYYQHIQKIQESGEGNLDKIKYMHDSALRDYDAFVSTQTMLWFGKRIEYIEFHLLNEMQAGQTVQAYLNVAGFVLYCAALFIGLVLPSLLVAVLIGSPASFGVVAGIAAAALTAVVTLHVSQVSFFKAEWNLGGDVLRTKFETAKGNADWDTFAKLRLDLHLAGRCVRAMATIKRLWENIGNKTVIQ